MFTTQIAQSGELTLFINGKAIHSLYNPAAEADTFLKKQIVTNIPKIFILIGPGLGYLKKSISRYLCQDPVQQFQKRRLQKLCK